MIQEFRGDPWLNERFQFWTFGYSTGDPIPYSASMLRRSLNEVRRKLDPDKADPAFDRMVLVGHSMGGLLTKMVVVESGDRIWRVVSERRVEEMQGEADDLKYLKDALIFHPQPEVSRVIFIATPHGGSEIDKGSIERIGVRFIRVPDLLLGVHRRLIDRNDQDFFKVHFRKGLPTSVEELHLGSPILSGLQGLAIPPKVRSHSIIAVRPDARPGVQTDGLVSLESARIEGVASEKVVSCTHLLCLERPEVVGEVRRILREHQGAD